MQSTTLRSRSATAATAAMLVLGALGALTAARPAAAQGAYGYYPQSAVVAQPAPEQFGWGRYRHRDHIAPRIFDTTPEHRSFTGDRGWTRITARVQDDRSGIDPNSVTLRVDGRDVTGRVRFDGEQVRYAEDLAPGRHMAELVVRDRAGNASREVWTFAVVNPERFGHGRGREPWSQRW